MQQQVIKRTPPEQEVVRQLAHLRRLDIFFHLFKTGRLVKDLIFDRRIQLYRKILFIITLVGLLAVLLFPDAIGDTALSIILPVIGTIAGIPLDAGFDWFAFALVSIHLLRYFPAEIVAEHYTDIFGRRRQS